VIPPLSHSSRSTASPRPCGPCAPRTPCALSRSSPPRRGATVLPESAFDLPKHGTAVVGVNEAGCPCRSVREHLHCVTAGAPDTEAASDGYQLHQRGARHEEDAWRTHAADSLARRRPLARRERLTVSLECSFEGEDEEESVSPTSEDCLSSLVSECPSLPSLKGAGRLTLGANSVFPATSGRLGETGEIEEAGALSGRR
jgi:hypothetical protein